MLFEGKTTGHHQATLHCGLRHREVETRPSPHATAVVIAIKKKVSIFLRK
jgi:hypothetical protein